MKFGVQSWQNFPSATLPGFGCPNRKIHQISPRNGVRNGKSERPRSLLLSLGVPSRPSPGSYPGPVQVPSRVAGGPVQIRHVLCFTVFRTHPGPEVGAIPARPGPILLPSVPYRIGPGRAETDFLATSEKIHANFTLLGGGVDALLNSTKQHSQFFLAASGSAAGWMPENLPRGAKTISNIHGVSNIPN